MTRVALLVVATTAACQPASAELPWVRGVVDVTVSETAIPGRVPDDELLCLHEAAFRRVELDGEVASIPGIEHLTASYADGVQLRRSDEALLSAVPGYACQGAADQVLSIALASAHGERVIVLALAAGGATDYTTRVELFQPAPDGRLIKVFAGVVEEHRGREVQRGLLVFLPGRLLHVEPTGEHALWRFDSAQHVYLPDHGDRDTTPPET